MADAAVETTPEQAPAEEVLGKSVAKREQSTSSVDSHQTKDGPREAPISPRRNGIPPKRTTVTAKRPLSSAPTPATKPSASSTSRTASGNSLSKPPTRPAPGSVPVPRKPAHAVDAATAASTGHRSRPSTDSIEEKPEPHPSSTDKSKKPVSNGTAGRVSMAPSASVRAPVSKSASAPTTKRVSMAPSITSEKKPTASRSAAAGPAKSAVKPATNSTIRPTTSNNAARTARPTASSTNTVKDGPMAEAAKKRLSAVSASPAPIQKPSSANTSAQPIRPGLPSRQSTLSVTIQQRLREMEMVHQMLSAAMADDDSGNHEDKEEASRRADEGIAMLKERLTKVRAEEAENQQAAAEGGVDVGTEDGHVAAERGVDHEVDQNEPKAEGDDSPTRHDENKEHQDGQIAQLRDQLKKSEATISELEADLQAEMLESSKAAQSIPKKVEDAIESKRQEHDSELDDLNQKHQAEVDTLHTKLEETQAKLQELAQQRAKDLEEARELATEEAQKEAGKNSEQDESTHAKALQALEERLAHEQEQSSSAKSRVEELTATLAELQDKVGEADGDRSRLESGHADVLARRDQELHGKDQVIDNLKAEMQKLQESKEEELDAAETASKKNASELEAELSRLESELKAARSASEDNTSTHEEAINAKDKELGTMSEKLRGLEEQLDTLSGDKQREFDTGVGQLREDHEKTLMQLKKDHDAALVSLSNEHTAAKDEELNIMTEKLRGLEEQLNTLSDNSQHEIGNRVGELRKEHENARSQLKNEHDATLASLRNDHTAALERSNHQLQELRQTHEEEKKKLSRDIETVRNVLGEELTEMTARKCILEKDLERANAADAEELQLEKEKSEALERQLEEVQNSSAAANNAAKEEAATTMASLEEKLEAAEAEAQRNGELSEDAKQALENATAEIEALKKALETFTEERQAEDGQHTATLERLKSEVEATSRTLEQSTHEIESATEQHNKEMQDLRDQHAAEKKAIEDSAGNRHQTAVDEVQAKYDALQQDLEKIQKDHRSEVEDLTAKYNEMTDIQASLAKEMTDMEDSHAKELEDAEGKHSENLQELMNEHKETYSRLRKELEEDKAKEVATAQEGHDTAMAELRTELQQEKTAAIQKEVEALEAHKAELEELRQASDRAIDEVLETHLEEVEALKKAAPKIDEEEAAQVKKDLESARTELQQTSDKLAEALENAERLKAQHDDAVQEIETVKANAAGDERPEAEPTPNHDAELQTQMTELRDAVDAADKENATLTAKLQQAENASERHALKLRELEAAYKVTSAELTEMQTRRMNGADYCASPTPKSAGLPSSKWADTSDDGEEDGTEGEELGSSIEGTMAGLQEQVRQLEEVNVDMLEETTRIVKMLSEVPQSRAARAEGSREES